MQPQRLADQLATRFFAATLAFPLACAAPNRSFSIFTKCVSNCSVVQCFSRSCIIPGIYASYSSAGSRGPNPTGSQSSNKMARIIWVLSSLLTFRPHCEHGPGLLLHRLRISRMDKLSRPGLAGPKQRLHYLRENNIGRQIAEERSMGPRPCFLYHQRIVHNQSSARWHAPYSLCYRCLVFLRTFLISQ